MNKKLEQLKVPGTKTYKVVISRKDIKIEAVSVAYQMEFELNE